MGEGREELSLQGLAERLEAQTHRLEVLERENAELRGKVAALERPEARRDDLAPRRVPKETGREAASRFSGSKEAVSRRAMLTKAGTAAFGAAQGPGEAKGQSPVIGPRPGWCEVRADIGRGNDADSR